MNVNLTLTKDYRKKDDFLVRINKPNFRNGQNERKLNFNKGLQKKRLFNSPKNKPNSNPISKRPKMNANVFATKDYENKTAFRPQKNKPKQTQWIKRIRSIFRRFILTFLTQAPHINIQTPIFSSKTRISPQNQKKNLKNYNFPPLWQIFVMAFVNIGC